MFLEDEVLFPSDEAKERSNIRYFHAKAGMWSLWRESCQVNGIGLKYGGLPRRCSLEEMSSGRQAM